MPGSVLDLVDLANAFSQQVPLTVDQFLRESERRGLRLVEAHLEALHHAGALVPIYRVRRDWRAYREIRRYDPYRRGVEVPFFLPRLNREALRQAALAGRLRDPHNDRFRPWRSYSRMVDGRRVDASLLLYSPYQLLRIPELLGVRERMRRRRTGLDELQFRMPRATQNMYVWPLPDFDYRDLVIGLSALEARYRPNITGRLTTRDFGDSRAWFDSWFAYRDTFNATEMLTWLGWDAERVHTSAKHLLLNAHAIDPLGPWHRVVRHARPDYWAKLKDAALVANECRIAAEMLLLFYEDLVREGSAAPLPETPKPVRIWAPEHERLTGQDEDIDAVLTEFGLSPHPALVLVLEGETELLLVPRVMDLLGVPRRRSFITIVNARGVKRDLSALAAFAGTPGIGESVGNGMLLTRPPTRFLLAFDSEKPFQDAHSREQKRKDWVDQIAKAVWDTYQVLINRDDLDQLVLINTWHDIEPSFELAHFSDEELADGIMSVYHGPDELSRSQLVAEVGRFRMQQREKGGKLNSVWKPWRKPHPTKTKLADALWPSLKAKIDEAVSAGAADGVPIARVVRIADRLARELPRHSVMIRTEDGSKE